jgi:hypothetical protein
MSDSPLVATYREILSKEGFASSVDEDGDVIFKYEGRTYTLIVDDDDPTFFLLARPNIWSIESPLERVRAEAAALGLNGQIKGVKIYVTDDDVWVNCEQFYDPVEDCKPTFLRALRGVQFGEKLFVDTMREAENRSASEE